MTRPHWTLTDWIIIAALTIAVPVLAMFQVPG